MLDFKKNKFTAVQLLLVSGIVVSILSGMINYYYIQEKDKTQKWVKHTTRVISCANRLDRAIDESELGQIGYLLTSNQTYLEKYQEAKKSIPLLLDSIGSMTIDNQLQQKIIRQKLIPQIIQKLEEFDFTIKLIMLNKNDSAVKIVNSDVSHYTIGIIKKELNHFIYIENQLKIERENQLASNYENYDLIVYSRFIFVILVLITALITIKRQENNNKKLIGELNQFNLQLEEKVIARTKELEIANIAMVKNINDLEDFNIRISRMNEEKSKFLSIASHDLKNPINAIMGLTSLLKEENENFNQEQKEYLNYIEESSQKMTSLINYLLDISKIELGNQTLRLEEVDITLITESIIYTYQQAAKKKGFKIIFKSDFRGKTLVTDKHRISQLLDNIYSNAIKYGRPGGIIQVTWEDKGLYCRLEIFNEGEGIKEDELPLLFGKFQKLSTRPTGGESSSGLGLSITKQYVEELEGTIRCVSELSKGTSFIVELPK